MDANTKATLIRYEYDDGTVIEYAGDDAEAARKWTNSCEMLAYTHGWEYKGPKGVETKRTQERE